MACIIPALKEKDWPYGYPRCPWDLYTGILDTCHPFSGQQRIKKQLGQGPGAELSLFSLSLIWLKCLLSPPWDHGQVIHRQVVRLHTPGPGLCHHPDPCEGMWSYRPSMSSWGLPGNCSKTRAACISSEEQAQGWGKSSWARDPRKFPQSQRSQGHCVLDLESCHHSPVPSCQHSGTWPSL